MRYIQNGWVMVLFRRSVSILSLNAFWDPPIKYAQTHYGGFSRNSILRFMVKIALHENTFRAKHFVGICLYFVING